MLSDVQELSRPVRALVFSFTALFLASVVATVIAVQGLETPEGPDLTALPLPADTVALDVEPTCGNGGCDGHGLVVSHPTMDADELIDHVAGNMERAGWSDDDCESDACLERGDLRTSIRAWTDAEGSAEPRLREGVHALGADGERLVYIRFYRCGVFVDCESA